MMESLLEPANTVVERNGLAEWRIEVVRACQVFVGRTLDADPAYFQRAVRLLARESPRPRSISENDFLRKTLAECAVRAAMRLHSEYHRHILSVPCTSSYLETIGKLWTDRTGDPCRLLRQWCHGFLEEFDRTHPWPAPVRAAIVLRRQRRRPVSLERLSRKLGVSRSALTRRFRMHYGVSLAEYHRRAKLRWIVEELRRPNSNVESIALRAGYRSVSSAYQALRLQTGFTPSEIRSFSDGQLCDLLDGALGLFRPGCARTFARGHFASTKPRTESLSLRES